MSEAVPLLSWNVLEHRKAAHPLPRLVFFAEAEERGCVSFQLTICFSMIRYSREKSSTKYLLSSTEDYNDHVGTQLNPSFHIMLVLRNRILKTGY